MAHVDLHLHLLPGVDDGPADEGASLAHAERIARAGVHEATVTPHVGHPDFDLDVATIPARTRALQAAIDAAGIELRLHPGGEIHPDGAADSAATTSKSSRTARRALAGCCSRCRSAGSTTRSSRPAGMSEATGSGC